MDPTYSDTEMLTLCELVLRYKRGTPVAYWLEKLDALSLVRHYPKGKNNDGSMIPRHPAPLRSGGASHLYGLFVKNHLPAGDYLVMSLATTSADGCHHDTPSILTT